MKKSKNYLALPAIVLAALYLTFLVNLHTLETSLQRVFIFCYFVVMGVLACFLKGKYAEGKPFPLQSRIAAALLAALLVGAGWNTFLPHVRFPLEGSHMYALWEKLLYTLGALCSILRSSRCCFSPAPWKSAAGRSDRKCSPFFSWETLCFSFSRAIASSRRI